MRIPEVLLGFPHAPELLSISMSGTAEEPITVESTSATASKLQMRAAVDLQIPERIGVEAVQSHVPVAHAVQREFLKNTEQQMMALFDEREHDLQSQVNHALQQQQRRRHRLPPAELRHLCMRDLQDMRDERAAHGFSSRNADEKLGDFQPLGAWGGIEILGHIFVGLAAVVPCH